MIVRLLNEKQQGGKKKEYIVCIQINIAKCHLFKTMGYKYTTHVIVFLKEQTEG